MLQRITLSTFLLLSAVVSAQHSVSGVINEENSHHRVKEIRLEGNDFIQTSTIDKNGQYQFKDVANGQYRLIVGKGKDEEIFVVTVKDGNVVYDVDLALNSNINLKEVHLQKNKSLKKEIENQGFAVNVIETKEAATRNIQTNELLDRTVGVRVRQSGGLGSSVEYNLNGMTGRSVGVFLDGIDIATYGSSFNLNNIPPAMIERIEVYKGVLPAHLSGDYLGGAINIVLKQGVSKNSLNAAISYGSFNTFQTDVNGMYRNKNNGFTTRASAFYTYSDNDYDIFGKFAKITEPDGRVVPIKSAKRFNDAYKTYGGRVEVGFTNVKWADQFLIGYNGTHAYKEIQHGLYMTKPYMGRFTESDANVITLSYTKKNFLVKKLDFNFNGNYSNRDQYIQDTVSWSYNWDGNIRRDIYGNLVKNRSGAQQGDPQMININRKIYTFRAGLNYNISDKHRLSFNHSYYTLDRFDDDKLKHALEVRMQSNSDLSKNVSALNYEAEWFNKRLRTNLFGKLYQQQTEMYKPKIVNGVYSIDHFVNDKEVLGYGLATSYALTKKLNVLVSVERAVRMPDAREIFGDEADNVSANPQINPEVSDNLNVGFRSSFFKMGEHELAISGNGFLRDVKDRIMQKAEETTSNQNPEVQPYVNIAKARSIGFEAELNYMYKKNLNIMFNLSKFNSLLINEKSYFHKQQVPNEPFFTANGNVQYKIKDLLLKQSLLNLFYNLNYVKSFNTVWYDSDYFMTPDQISHDLGLSYRFPKRNFIVSIDAKNIFNAEIYDNYAAQKPGRAFYLKLNYTINKF